jgi:hypothetical protein
MAKVVASDIGSVVLNEVPPFMMDNYKLRVKEALFDLSKASGNPMLTLRCEITSPLEVMRSGKKYSLDGLTVTFYFVTRVIENGILNEEKTAKKHGEFLEFLKKMDLPQEFDDENVDPVVFEGLEFYAILNSQESKPTKVNQDTGKREPILDAAGQPIVNGWEIQANNRNILKKA